MHARLENSNLLLFYGRQVAILRQRLGRNLQDWDFNEAPRLSLLGKQRLYFLPQSGIIPASFPQKSGSLTRLLAQSRLPNLLDLVPAFSLHPFLPAQFS